MIHVTNAAKRAGLALLLGLAVATCRDDPNGPGRGYRASLALAPVLPQHALNLAAFGLAIDSLRVVIVRPPTDTVVDTTVAFAVDQDSISLALSLDLEATSEQFDVVLQLRGGGFVLFSAAATVDVHEGGAGSNEPLEIADFVYAGPGANVTTLLVTPVDSVIRLGDSLRFRVDALADGIPVTQFYVSWSSSNAALAPINAHGVLKAPNQRGAVIVTATTPNGATAAVPVTFVPVPTSIVSVPPIPQNVLPGTLFGQLQARVLASDGLGVKGIPVTFQAVSGGGSVTNAIVVTDSGGFAATTATSGTGTLSVFSATVAGVATPALFNVSVLAATATQLVFTVPPAGGVVDLPIVAFVEIRDAQGTLVPGANDPVTVAFGANPGGATLGGTLTVNAVSGTVVFTDLTIDQPGTGYTLVATAPGLTPDTTPPFDVIPGFTGKLWTNAAGGNWNDPANWSGGVVPGVNDTVYVALDGDYTVNLDVNATVDVLLIGGSSGSQRLQGLSRTLQVNALLTIGPTGVLELTNSTLSGVGGAVFNSGQLLLQAVDVAPNVLNFSASGLTVRGNTTFNAGFTNGIDAHTRIEADPFCCSAAFTVAGGITNLGMIELTAVNGTGTTATLAASSTVFNLAGGTIAVLAGTGGGRNLQFELDNAGTLLVEQDVTLSQASAAHVNSGVIQLAGGSLTVSQSGTTPSFATTGSIVVGAGRTLQVNGGAFEYDNPVPGGLAGLGTVSLSSVALDITPDVVNDTLGLSFVNSTVTGGGTLTNAFGRTLTVQATAINVPFVNQGTFVARGASSLGGTVTAAASGTIRLQADPFCCSAALTVASGFTNNGLLELTAINGGGTTAILAVTSGTLVNATGATIASLPGTGGLREIQAQLSNDGTVLVAQDLVLNKASADHLNSGLIQLTGGNLTLSQSGSSPTFTTLGSIVVGPGRTLAVNSGAFQYSNASPGGLAGLGTITFSSTAIALIQSLVNDTLTVSFVNSTVAGPATLTNAAGRTLTAQASTINAPFVNQGLFVARGASTLGGGLTTAPGSTIQIQADPFCCSAALTVTSGFTNTGLLELTAVNGTGTTATLDMPSGFLVNATGGIIASRAGTGGARNLQVALNNQGSIVVEQDLTVNAPSADHLNSGTITLTTGSLTLNQSGTTPTFTTTGTVIVGAGRTLQVNGNVFNYANAAPGGLAGLGTVAFSGAVLNLTPSFSNDSLSLSLLNSTVAGPGTLTNAVGRTLTMQATALNAPFVNQGLLVARGGSSLGSSSVTAAAGGTIRVEADPFCCSATLSVANPFTNDGMIELTSINGTGTTASLDVAGGLTNGTDGTIALLPGSGGARTLPTALTNNGLIIVGTAATIGTANASYVNNGTIDASGGNLTLPLTGTTPVFTNQGTITVGAGLTVAVQGGAAGTFANAGTGTLAGHGTFDVSSTTFTNNGTVAPGGSPGALTFIGTYSMGASAVLSVELGGATPGTQYDQVVVGGTGTLAGTLNVTLINGFTPSIGQVFTVVAGGNVTGLLASLNLPSVAGAIWLPNLSAAGLQLSLISASALLPVIWTNPAGGNWSNGLNWSTGTPPGPGDSAVINLGGPLTVTVDAAATAAFLDLATAVGGATKTLALAGQTLTLSAGGIVGGDGVVNLSGGTLTGGGSLQVNGALNWTSGLISGAGIVQVGPTGTLTLSGTGTKSLNSRTIQTAGTVTWSGTGAINAGGGAVVEIQPGGTFAANADAIVAHSLGGAQPHIVVDPGGTFARSAGTGAAGLFVPFDNAGAVAVNSGTLELRGSGTNSGTFAVGSGALLDIPSGTYSLGTGTQFSGTGLVRIAGGTVNVDGATPIPVNRLQLLSGSLQGVGTLDVQDSLVWSGGTMQGAGITNVPAGADLVLNGTTLSFSARTIVNAGAVTWIAGNIFSGSGATLQNVAGGVVDLRADASWFHNMGGTVPQLANLAGGVVQRSIGTGTVDVRAAVNSAGTVQVLSGTLALNGGGTSGGSFTAVPGSELTFGGVHALTAAASLSAGGRVTFATGSTTIGGVYDVTGQTQLTLGNVQFNGLDTARVTTLDLQGGTLGGTGVVLLRGPGNWSGGTLGGTGVLRVPAGVTLNVAGPVVFSARTIANAGQVIWSGGTLSSGLGATLRNESGGLFDIQGATGWFHNQGGVTPLIDNLAGGTVRRSTSAGAATLNVPLANNGTVDVQTGTLVLNAGAASGGAHVVGTGATLQYGSGLYSLTTGAALTGPGRVLVTSATLNIDAAAPDTVDARWIELTGGTLGGLGVLRMLDSLVWTGGQLNDAGVLRIPVGGQLLIRGATGKTFRTRTIANAGVVSWTGTGAIASGVNAALVNENGGFFQLESDADWLYNLGGVVPHIDNLTGGLIKRGAATSDITVGAALNNDGTLDLQTGSVTFTNGGSSKGTFLLTAPGTAGFGGGSHTLDVGSLVTGNGTFQVSAGTVTETGDYNVTGLTRVVGGAWVFDGSKPAEVTTLDVSGGSLSGLGIVNLHGAGTWTSGSMTGTGQLRVFPGAALSIDGKDPKIFTQRTILNAGLVTWTNTGSINSGSAAVLTNQAGATFELQGDASWVYNMGGGAPTVNNAGSLKRNASAGPVVVQAVVNNTGNVDVSSGTLSLNGGGANTGLYAVSSGAVLDFGGGTHTLSGATTRLNGAGSVTFTAGAVTFSGTAPSAYDITGTTLVDGGTATFNTTDTTRFTALLLRNGTLDGSANMVVRGSGLWTGGALAAPPALPAAVVLRVPQGVAFNINGAATKPFTKRTILVDANGAVNWLGGSVLAGNGATLDVQSSAVFNVSAVGAWSTGAGVPFINIRDRANMNVTTTGTTTLGAALVFNNQGTLDIAAGATLKVQADLNQLGGSTLQGKGVLDVTGNSRVVNQGTVRPGTSPGVFTIVGNWPQGPGSTLVIEVFGPAPGTGHDQLVVTGQLTSGGALQLVGNGVYAPRTLSLKVATFGSRTGQTFSVSLLGGLTGLLGINYSLTDLQMAF